MGVLSLPLRSLGNKLLFWPRRLLWARAAAALSGKSWEGGGAVLAGKSGGPSQRGRPRSDGRPGPGSAPPGRGSLQPPPGSSPHGAARSSPGLSWVRRGARPSSLPRCQDPHAQGLPTLWFPGSSCLRGHFIRAAGSIFQRVKLRMRKSRGPDSCARRTPAPSAFRFPGCGWSPSRAPAFAGRRAFTCACRPVPLPTAFSSGRASSTACAPHPTRPEPFSHSAGGEAAARRLSESPRTAEKDASPLQLRPSQREGAGRSPVVLRGTGGEARRVGSGRSPPPRPHRGPEGRGALGGRPVPLRRRPWLGVPRLHGYPGAGGGRGREGGKLQLLPDRRRELPRAGAERSPSGSPPAADTRAAVAEGGAESAAAAGPGARDSWAARVRGVARHAPGPDGADAPSRARGRRDPRSRSGHCPPTAALGSAGPGGGRPSWAPSPGAESPHPGGMGPAAAGA
ncbi:uncharacterized protein LOC107000856 [Macaca mulatta]